MRIADIKPGMAVRFPGRGIGVVARVGFVSVWVDLCGDFGKTTVITGAENLQPAERSQIRLGGFTVHHLGSGKIRLEYAGQELGCDEAQIEGLLEKFWAKHF